MSNDTRSERERLVARLNDVADDLSNGFDLVEGRDYIVHDLRAAAALLARQGEGEPREPDGWIKQAAADAKLQNGAWYVSLKRDEQWGYVVPIYIGSAPVPSEPSEGERELAAIVIRMRERIDRDGYNYVESSALYADLDRAVALAHVRTLAGRKGEG
jgi:hypothetical protein